MLPSYSSLIHIGHRTIKTIFDGPVVVQEKVDGSQISFGVNAEGELFMRSKGAQLNLAAPDKMFAKGVEAVQTVFTVHGLKPGFVYRGEYLQRPKHNTLAYDRTPKQHIVIFDVEDRNQGEQFFLTSAQAREEAERLGFEYVPIIYEGVVSDTTVLRGFLDRVSFLGGAKIEGVVVKNYSKFTTDHKVMMGKFVSEEFKEVHSGSWKEANPTQKDIQTRLIDGLRTPARFQKAVQHLRDAGVLTDSPKDIGPLIKEVQADIKKECLEEIADALVEHFLPHILRGVANAVPEWYKDQLLRKSFETEADPVVSDADPLTDVAE